jgi:hypothetical protein
MRRRGDGVRFRAALLDGQLRVRRHLLSRWLLRRLRLSRAHVGHVRSEWRDLPQLRVDR